MFVSAFVAASSMTGCGGGGGGSGGTGGTGAAGGAGASGGAGGVGGVGGSGGMPNTACYDYSGFDGTMPAVSFKTDVLPIFQRSCGVSSSCHGDPNMPNENRPYLGPNKSTTATADDIQILLAGIVDVTSFYEPKMSIVATGDPANSFLMYKLDDTLECDTLQCSSSKDCGGIMPQGAEVPLELEERDLVRRWIAQGAKND